ncbi:MAG: flagellar biosynthesis regulator FlaF [Alphaproteobacteria bacterium]|nr:flagellar biosynthesis regulator FlaF [Alphaproteobacteria bacterium]
MPPRKPADIPSKNPYAQAAGAYGGHAQQTATDQRELEGRVLIKAANMIRDLRDNWDSTSREVIEATLKHNRQIWLMFYDTALENPEGNRPKDLRSNIINLANFIFKREIDILADPKKEKLDVLININREIAAGLMNIPQGGTTKK